MLFYEQQLKLALAICKKLFFDYQQFYEVNNWDNPNILPIEKSATEKPDKALRRGSCTPHEPHND